MEVNWKLLVLAWGIMLVPAFCVVMRRIIKCRINESYHTLKEDAGASLNGIDFALGIVWSVFWPFTLMMYVVCRMGWFLWNGLLLRAILVTIDDGSKPNGTYTKAGYVYDANKLRPIGALQEFKGGGSSTIRAERHKMICLEEIATGERFIFSVNHFKAKSGSGYGRDADQGDGQASFNGGRTDEAESVVSYYKTRYSPAIKEKDILIMGDLNAYAKEDPITLFLENGMIDLHRAFHADSSYSYQYSARAGYLDHALCNNTLYRQVTGMCGFHINSDEDDRYTYDGAWSDNTMFRCSDHDPVIVALKLDSTLTYEPAPTLNNAEILAGETDKLIISNAYKDGGQSFYAIYSVNGLLLEQKEIVSEYQKIELPTAPGVYIVYIYADGKVHQRKMIVR